MDPLPTLQVLNTSITKITEQIKNNNSIDEDKKADLLKLLDKQKNQLETLITKYNTEKALITKKQLQADLTTFFETGTKLRKHLQSIQLQKTKEYSPDPSQCANHCYQTCGYDSLGDKVCWYTCYYCCGQGGC